MERNMKNEQWICIFHTSCPWRVSNCKDRPQEGSIFPLVSNNIDRLKSACKCKFFESTDQLCDLFLNDLFDLDVVYLVMAAELLCKCGFAHCWRSNQADSGRLKEINGKKEGILAFIWYQSSFLRPKYPIKMFVWLRIRYWHIEWKHMLHQRNRNSLNIFKSLLLSVYNKTMRTLAVLNMFCIVSVAAFRPVN